MQADNSQEELFLFIAVYVASADGSIHTTELDTIHAKANELFPQIESLDQMILSAEASILRTGREAAEKHIEGNLETLSRLHPAQKASLLQFLFDVLNADGRVNEEEIRIIRKLRSALTTS